MKTEFEERHLMCFALHIRLKAMNVFFLGVVVTQNIFAGSFCGSDIQH